MKDAINKLKFNTYKKNIMITLIFIILIILVFISISFAYMNTTQDEVVITSVDAEAGQVDDLTFTTGNTLTFTSGTGNLSGSTTFSATLNKHPLRDSGDSTYNVTLEVMENDFIYTTLEDTAELILTIIDPNGNEIIDIPHLDYVTVDGISGFDVTVFQEALVLVENYPINTTSTTTQTWNVTLTLVDLESNQTLNNNKTFNAEFGLNSVLEKLPLNKLSLAHNGGVYYINHKTTPVFNSTSTTDEGMFVTADDYGNSYYYRGAVEDNWLYFANYYWKIVRINGDSTIRLIYMGKTKPNYITRISGGGNIGISSSAFNPASNSAEYVGYMYTLGEQHGLDVSSTMKTHLETWYNTYLIDYNDYISDTLFCNDRTVTSGPGIGAVITKFSARERIYVDYNPSLICANQLDRFTVEDSLVGNASLTHPIALLTADEAYFAGLKNSFTVNYLSQSLDELFMTPFEYDMFYSSNTTGIFSVTDYIRGRHQDDFHFSISSTSSGYQTRPVINLKADTLVSGTGTWDDPYIVDGFVINKYN